MSIFSNQAATCGTSQGDSHWPSHIANSHGSTHSKNVIRSSNNQASFLCGGKNATERKQSKAQKKTTLTIGFSETTSCHYKHQPSWFWKSFQVQVTNIFKKEKLVSSQLRRRRRGGGRINTNSSTRKEQSLYTRPLAARHLALSNLGSSHLASFSLKKQHNKGGGTMCWWLMQPWGGGIKVYPSKCSLSPHTAIKKPYFDKMQWMHVCSGGIFYQPRKASGGAQLGCLWVLPRATKRKKVDSTCYPPQLCPVV